MNKKIIKLEEILEIYVDNIVEDITEVGCIKVVLEGTQVPDIIFAMKEACKQVLELAANNAKCEKIGEGVFAYIDIVNRQSILDTINQIE